MKPTTNLCFFILTTLLVILWPANSSKSTASAIDYWTYKHYATLTKEGVTFVILYYGERRDGYNGYIKWKAENKTNKEIYDFWINKRTYTLTDGTEIILDPVDFISHITKPGDENTTQPEKVNADSFKETKLKIKKVVVEAPEMKFRFKEKGKHHEWNTLGEIELEH